MPDLSQDLRGAFGVSQRVPIQHIYALPTEFESSGEIVSAVSNDNKNQIRFVGSWALTTAIL